MVLKLTEIFLGYRFINIVDFLFLRADVYQLRLVTVKGFPITRFKHIFFLLNQMFKPIYQLTEGSYINHERKTFLIRSEICFQLLKSKENHGFPVLNCKSIRTRMFFFFKTSSFKLHILRIQ